MRVADADLAGGLAGIGALGGREHAGAELLELRWQVRRTVRLVHTPPVKGDALAGLSCSSRELDGLLVDRVVQLEHGNVVGRSCHAPVPAGVYDDAHDIGHFPAGRPVLGADAHPELLGVRGDGSTTLARVGGEVPGVLEFRRHVRHAVGVRDHPGTEQECPAAGVVAKPVVVRRVVLERGGPRRVAGGLTAADDVRLHGGRGRTGSEQAGQTTEGGHGRDYGLSQNVPFSCAVVLLLPLACRVPEGIRGGTKAVARAWRGTRPIRFRRAGRCRRCNKASGDALRAYRRVRLLPALRLRQCEYSRCAERVPAANVRLAGNSQQSVRWRT